MCILHERLSWTIKEQPKSSSVDGHVVDVLNGVTQVRTGEAPSTQHPIAAGAVKTGKEPQPGRTTLVTHVNHPSAKSKRRGVARKCRRFRRRFASIQWFVLRGLTSFRFQSSDSITAVGGEIRRRNGSIEEKPNQTKADREREARRGPMTER